MSLIISEILTKLWREAQGGDEDKDEDEWKQRAVWEHLYAKHIFSEENWIVGTDEQPCGDDTQRRLDITVRYINQDGKLSILIIHETRPNAGPNARAAVTEVEHRAKDACMRYLARPEFQHLQFVYAVTSLGTKARCWRYDKGVQELEAYTGNRANVGQMGEYIELNSSDATALRQTWNVMTERLPA